ncbi:unnamed protein product, partial [marine sediment metagenome]
HRLSGAKIGLVPTMGALHEGHLGLIRRARNECDTVVVSIYVNPAQFGSGEDLEKYPRQLQTDVDCCEAEGVDYVFAPSDAEMYGSGALTTIHVAKLTERLCGAFRPGHFDGVCTVVAKLFNIVQPDLAYFGQKDAQQAIVIQRMVAELNLPLRIAVCPTVRDPDGLAISSRNAYLSAKQREQATCLYRALRAGREAILAGVTDPEELAGIMRKVVQAAGPCQIDYLEAVDADTLEPISEVQARTLLLGAIRLDGIRLIDNIVVEQQ